MLMDALGTVFQIALDHQTLHQALDIPVLVAAVDHILGNADLL